MSPVAVGDLAPDFVLPADDRTTFSLSSLRGRKVVLYFYPKDNTSGCTAQACAYRDTSAELAEKNALVVGISRDSSKSHQGFRAKHGLPFLLLTDTDHAVHEVYGAWGEKTMYGKKVQGAIRTTVLIDEQGRVLDLRHKVKAAEDPARVLGLLG